MGGMQWEWAQIWASWHQRQFLERQVASKHQLRELQEQKLQRSLQAALLHL